jgi:hypothetical protein
VPRGEATLVRAAPANSEENEAGSSVAKDLESRGAEESRAASLVPTRLPEDPRYTLIPSGEAGAAAGRAIVEPLGYAAEALVFSRPGLGMSVQPTLPGASAAAGGQSNGTQALLEIKLLHGVAWEPVVGHDRRGDEPPLSDAHDADLFAAFSMCDQDGLERAIDRLIDRLIGLDGELKRLATWSDVIAGVAAMAVAIAAVQVIRRHLRTEWDDPSAPPCGGSAAWPPGLPGLPPHRYMED